MGEEDKFDIEFDEEKDMLSLTRQDVDNKITLDQAVIIGNLVLDFNEDGEFCGLEMANAKSAMDEEDIEAIQEKGNKIEMEV